MSPGIGINVQQDASDWPTELRSSAESLNTLGVMVRRSVLAGVLIDELRPLIAGLSLTAASMRMRRSSSSTAVIQDRTITVRVDSDDHFWNLDTLSAPGRRLCNSGSSGRNRLQRRSVTPPIRMKRFLPRPRAVWNKW
jgi:biotin-(acetyl-CoA carboxylase) ligase